MTSAVNDFEAIARAMQPGATTKAAPPPSDVMLTDEERQVLIQLVTAAYAKSTTAKAQGRLSDIIAKLNGVDKVVFVRRIP